MSNLTNDQLLELAAEVIDELHDAAVEGTLPTLVSREYARLVSAMNVHDMEAIYEITHSLGQYLANDKASL